MKSTGLMIGDWVLYNGKPVKVLQLSEGRDYKYITPVPLTQEILEKNGFDNNEGEENFYHKTNDLSICLGYGE